MTGRPRRRPTVDIFISHTPPEEPGPLTWFIVEAPAGRTAEQEAARLCALGRTVYQVPARTRHRLGVDNVPIKLQPSLAKRSRAAARR